MQLCHSSWLSRACASRTPQNYPVQQWYRHSVEMYTRRGCYKRYFISQQWTQTARVTHYFSNWYCFQFRFVHTQTPDNAKIRWFFWKGVLIRGTPQFQLSSRSSGVRRRSQVLASFRLIEYSHQTWAEFKSSLVAEGIYISSESTGSPHISYQHGGA